MNIIFLNFDIFIFSSPFIYIYIHPFNFVKMNYKWMRWMKKIERDSQYIHYTAWFVIDFPAHNRSFWANQIELRHKKYIKIHQIVHMLFRCITFVFEKKQFEKKNFKKNIYLAAKKKLIFIKIINFSVKDDEFF